tara:strand:+ start:2632 stop:3579 length:948 start_codon:yes stop_codon:yes gene_type:complete
MYNFWPNKQKKIKFHLNKKKIIDVENFIKNQFQNSYPLYFSSGRSAIVSCLKSFNLKRESIVGFSPYSNACIFQTLGNISTPVALNMKEDFDACLIHNQWGYLQKFDTNCKNIIEDSIDSLILNSKTLFQNNGKYEIFSLSKIFGIPFGAVVFCRNEELLIKLKLIRDNQKKYSNMQIFLKYLSNFSKIADGYWQLGETYNAYPGNVINDLIFKNLNNYKHIVQDRLEKIKIMQNFVNFKIDENRLPIILPIKINEIQKKEINKLNKFIFFERHLNTSFNLNNWHLEKFFPLPIHQEVEKEVILNVKQILEKKND